MRGSLLSAAAATVIALAATTSAAPAATVAQPGGVATAVRELGGTIVFSEYAQAERRWYLSVRETGAEQRRIAVAPSAVPFDADIGTDSKGRPQLIYQRCAGTVSARTGCELFVFSLADATGERPVRNANDPGRNDVGPTLWRGRIAWTREYGAGEDADPVVYTKTLTAPRSQPSTRLPGVPTVRCAEALGLVEPPCGPTTFRRVTALELWGDNLGLIVSYLFEGLGGTSQTEARLSRVSDRSARQVDFLETGLNGQSLVGPSFFSGRMAWYRACAVAEASCRTFVGPGATGSPRAATSGGPRARGACRASPTPARVSTRSSTAPMRRSPRSRRRRPPRPVRSAPSPRPPSARWTRRTWRRPSRPGASFAGGGTPGSVGAASAARARLPSRDCGRCGTSHATAVSAMRSAATVRFRPCALAS